VARRYELVPSSSMVRFHAESSVHPIDVRADGIEGSLHAETGDDGGLRLQPPGRFTVPVAALRSGNRLIDRETRRRLAVDRHPVIVAELVDAHPIGDGRFRARGRVTVGGVAREVEGELRAELDEDGRLHLCGRETFDVRRWEIRPPDLLVLKVHPTVDVTVDLEAQAGS
jgi:polyisoprenoid-binding protein YceI